MTTYICHHGIKGQRWGIRRFQNSDGSLTDEGRRHYGYGKGRGIITPNTKQRIKQGVKIGAKVGATIGSTAFLGTTLPMIAAGVPTGLAIASGAHYVATFAAAGAFDGLRLGSIVGAVETTAGRAYINKHDSGLADFEERERKSE